MIENILARKGISLKIRLTVKSLVSAGVIILAVVLPQLVHLAAGPSGGMTWLPMYLPVLLGGCLLGTWWGLGVGILSPLVSFAVTSAMGSAMPAAARLPFMTAELAVFAAVSGLFSAKISENGWMAFPAVLLAAVSGRAVFLLLTAIFQSVAPFTVSVVWSQIQSGFIGLILQAVLVPLMVMGIRALMRREKND
ncbi:MAG: ECF transporter S component [Christensenellaceae bacterium]|jgi:hypothetical protein